MTQLAVDTEPNTIEVAKQTAARLGRVIDIFPASTSITEGTHLSGTFDTFNDAGIPTPDAAAVISDGGAGVMSGDRAVYVVFRDDNRDQVGNPSAISNTLTITNRIISIDLTNITNETTNSRVTHIELYVNLSTGGSIYYLAATITVATTSTTINVSDATLQANDTLETDNDPPAVETYGWCVSHKGYMFLGGAHSESASEYEDDWINSKVNSADNFPLLNRVKVEPGRYGRLMIAVPTGDALIFYKEHALYELHFDTDPSGIFGDGYAKTVNTKRGTLNKRTVANVQGVHFVMDRLGIYAFTGGTSYRELASKLHHYWRRINWGRKAWFHAAVDEDRVYFFVALDGDDENKYAFVLDLNAWYARGDVNWYVYKFDFGVRDSCQHMIGGAGLLSARRDAAVDNAMEGVQVVAVITEYGYTGYMAAGYRDLVDPLLTAQGTTTSIGTTTTFIDSAATWQRTNDASSTVNPVGAYVKFTNPNADNDAAVSWDDAYRITGYSGTGPTLTFTPAAPEAVPSGTTYTIGRIPDAVLHSAQFGFDAAHHTKQAARVGIEFQPGGVEFSVNMKISTDRRANWLTRITAENSEYTSTDRLGGVEMKMGGGLDGGRHGVHAQPASGRGFRYMQIILDATGVDKPAAIDGILVDEVNELDAGGT